MSAENSPSEKNIRQERFNPPPEQIIQPQRGDILVSSLSVPHADSIRVVRNNTAKLNSHYLLEYLNFLELVALNERVIVGEYDVLKHLDPSVFNSPAAGKIANVFQLVSDLGIEKKALDLLRERGIFYEAEIYSGAISPRDYLEAVS
ncbi:MAG TPA: hypothetical protein VFS10_09815 [Pyrinomonadaceae bacterium]|nr:hypothetical protein [Pyrinomonadaceae bacterium]